MTTRVGCALVAAGLALAATADEVFFKSGDKLTGTVKTIADGTMVFDSAVAGEIKLKLEDIKTFTAAAETGFLLKTGELVTSTIPNASADPDQVLLANGAKVSFADIDKLNPPPPDEVKWTGKISAGLSLVRGNTHTTAGNLSFDAHRRSENLRLSADGAYYTEKTKDVSTKDESTTADNWYIKGQADWFFTEKNYFFVSAKYERDRIALLDQRLMLGAGYGYQWIERPDMNFSTEAGLYYTDERYMEGDKGNFCSARLGYHFDKTFLDKIRLYHNLEYIPNFESSRYFLMNGDLGIAVPLYESLMFDAKIDWKYNSHPADGRYRNDTRYIAGLSWMF